ncbi:hypothetical protein SNEBB_009930 [Seison nebaliae]|nr:hypothetical protein SNEBB_009930 [Seison nebaliae]
MLEDGSNVAIYRGTLILIFQFLLFILEIVAAHMCHALVIQVDAYYRLSRCLHSCIRLIGIYFVIKRGEEKNSMMTYGWKRMTIVADLTISIFTCALCLTISMECLKHLIVNRESENFIFQIAVGFISLLINLIIVGLYFSINLSSDSEEKLSITQMLSKRRKSSADDNDLDHVTNIFGGAFSTNVSLPHLLIRCIALLCGPLCIIGSGSTCLILQMYQRPHWIHLDTILTIISLIFIFGAEIISFKPIAALVMQSSPDDCNPDQLKTDISGKCDGYIEVNELHIWEITTHNVVITCHITFDDVSSYTKHIRKIYDLLYDKFGKETSITIEPIVRNMKKIE